MYRLLLFSLVLASLLGCSSDSDNDIQDPVLPPSVLNTGKLLSIDGGQLHIAFSYDTQGRVTTFERFDSTYISVRKHQAGYKYEGSRIFIEYEEFEELPDGERDPSSGRDIMRHDTLFVVNNRVDSCAGDVQGGTCFFYKFIYDDKGRLVTVRNDNVQRDHSGKLRDKPWYTERIILEWEDENVAKKTLASTPKEDTTEWRYRYSPLKGSLVLGNPKNILDDFIPLESEGYFGIPCRNLLQGGESGGYAWQDEYELDPSQMVKSVREKVTSPDGNSMSLYEFKIRWK